MEAYTPLAGEGAAPALVGQTIEIGIAGPFSGPSQALGSEMRRAAELAIVEQNAAGGISGAVLASVLIDDASVVERGRVGAETLCGRASVLGVIGHYDSDVGLAASEVYDAAGLAMVNPIVSNPDLTERGTRTVFRLINRDDRTAAAIADYLLVQLAKERVVIFATDSRYGSSMTQCFARAFWQRGGEIVAKRRCGVGQRDMRDLVDSLPRDVDVFFYGGTFEGAALLRALRARGFPQRFATGDGCWDVHNFLEPAGRAAEEAEGVLVLSAAPEIGRVPGSSAFADRYVRRYGPIHNYAATSYDSARVLLEALARAARSAGARPSRGDVVQALRQTQFQGIAYKDPIRWDTHGDNVNATTALHEIREGRFQQIAELTSRDVSSRAPIGPLAT